jgi:hypothetical protein
MQYNVGMGMLPNKGANIGINTLKSFDLTLENFLKKYLTAPDRIIKVRAIG